MDEVINTVKAFLDARKLTPYRLATDCGISRTTAYRLAREPELLPDGRVIAAICDTYQIEPGEILKTTPRALL